MNNTLSYIKDKYYTNIKLIISNIADKYDIPESKYNDIFNTDIFKNINTKISRKYQSRLKKLQIQQRNELCLNYYSDNMSFDMFIRYIEIVYHKNIINIDKDNIVSEFNRVSKIHILTALYYAFKSVNMDVCRNHLNKIVLFNDENRLSNRSLLFRIYKLFINKSATDSDNKTSVNIYGTVDMDWECDDNQCMARVWRKGNANSQCSRKRYNKSEYCKSHFLKSQETTQSCIKKDKKRIGLYYGRIDDTAPEKNDNNEIVIQWKINRDYTSFLPND